MQKNTPQQNQHLSDHDVLMRLDVRFSDFMDKSWPELINMLGSVADKIEKKADRAELEKLRVEVQLLKENRAEDKAELNKVSPLEKEFREMGQKVELLHDEHTRSDTRKEAFLDVKNWTLKTWTFLTTAVITVYTILHFITGG